MADTPVQLDYAPPPPRWFTTRRARRVMTWLAVTLLIAGAVYTSPHWGKWLEWKYGTEQARRRYARCLTYENPAGQVVWERSPALAAELLRSPDYVQLRAADTSPLAVAAKYPPAWQEFARMNSWGQDSAIVFLHARKFPGERPIAVAVEYCAGRPGVGPHFAASLVEPGSFMESIRFKVADVACLADVPMRINYGQADPIDESHFTVRATASDGIEDIYDGWLGPPKFKYRMDDLADVRMVRRPRGTSAPAR